MISWIYTDWGLVRESPLESFLVEFHLFYERIEIPSPGALPRILAITGKDCFDFIYFGLIFIILKRKYEESSSVTVLKQS